MINYKKYVAFTVRLFICNLAWGIPILFKNSLTVKAIDFKFYYNQNTLLMCRN